ncbi:enoyl-CoA hydratase/isomerase family protein [Prauserella oleivorans]|uniref:Enoyl-CoA hydratase/isomerase family protein n=1 Tax=Prauserella oleivorans TaxID=1478153 RepID=A0ABW5WDI6_9PSEU
MSSIQLGPAEGVAVVRLAHGKANALDTELCERLLGVLDDVLRAGHPAVVLTGTAGVFSAGVDLRRLVTGGAAYVREFLPVLSEVFLTLFDFPRPVVAAINGHAIAGGAVLAAACDARVMNADHGMLGWTELRVGVPFPLAATEILRCAYGSPALTELMVWARTWRGPDALARGLVDAMAAEDAVVGRAAELARTLGRVPPEAFLHTKRQLHRPFNERIGEHGPSDDAHVEHVWSAPETLATIRSYVAAMLGD